MMGASTCAGYGSAVRDTPDIHGEFLKVNFVVQNATHTFSLIGKDQYYEQSNNSPQARGGSVSFRKNVHVSCCQTHYCASCVDQFEAEHEVVSSIFRVRELGEYLHAQYVTQTLYKVTMPVSNIIRSNTILTFSKRPDLTKKGNKTSGVQKKKNGLL